MLLDCGIVMKSGAISILTKLFTTDGVIKHDYEDLYQDPIALCNQIADCISSTMGGTSGILLEIFIRAMSTSLESTLSKPDDRDDEEKDALQLLKVPKHEHIGSSSEQHFHDIKSSTDFSAHWIKALEEGSRQVQLYGGAVLGMRTLLDALLPAILCLVEGQSLKQAALAAQIGAQNTKNMQSLAGRSNYINDELLKGTPDPGAVAVAEAFLAAAAYLTP